MLEEFMPMCEQLTASSLTSELLWRQRSLAELPGQGWACLGLPPQLHRWGISLEQAL